MDKDFAILRTKFLVVAYVSRNAVTQTELCDLIRRVYVEFIALQVGPSDNKVSQEKSASEIAASIRYERLISFIDGRAYKSLKRHLTVNGLTPSEYRARYGLPSDYPMVSPSYAQDRSRIAKQAYLRFGLERKQRLEIDDLHNKDLNNPH